MRLTLSDLCQVSDIRRPAFSLLFNKLPNIRTRSNCRAQVWSSVTSKFHVSACESSHSFRMTSDFYNQALPPWWGGLGLCSHICCASQKFSASLKITEPLHNLILHHDLRYSKVKANQLSQKSSIWTLKQDYCSKSSTYVREHFDSSLWLALDLAVEKGALTWLTALPLDEYGFALHKSAFQNALALRYGWLPLCAPTLCL